MMALALGCALVVLGVAIVGYAGVIAAAYLVRADYRPSDRQTEVLRGEGDAAGVHTPGYAASEGATS